MLKIHIYQYNDPLEISSPPDEESYRTTIRSLTGMSIYTIKSSKSAVLQVQSICTIFGLDYNTFYIETEVSLLNSSKSSMHSTKAIYRVEVSNGKNSFGCWTTPESLSLTQKILIYRDKGPPVISSPPDEESCRTAIKITHRYINLYC